MAKVARLGSLVLALTFLLGPWLAGCADRGKSRDARLDRLEARLDRLDDRLTRTEARVSAVAGGTPSGGGLEELAGFDREIESAIRRMNPESRERIRKHVFDIQHRMEKLREAQAQSSR